MKTIEGTFITNLPYGYDWRFTFIDKKTCLIGIRVDKPPMRGTYNNEKQEWVFENVGD